MKVFMVIIFILSNGQEMVPNQGRFVPRPFDTIEQCERVRLAAHRIYRVGYENRTNEEIY